MLVKLSLAQKSYHNLFSHRRIQHRLRVPENVQGRVCDRRVPRLYSDESVKSRCLQMGMDDRSYIRSSEAKYISFSCVLVDVRLQKGRWLALVRLHPHAIGCVWSRRGEGWGRLRQF